METTNFRTGQVSDLPPEIFFMKIVSGHLVGLEISNKKVAYNTLYETSFFQAGFYYNKTYLIVNGTPINDIGGSIGMGVNSKRSVLSLLVVLQYGIKGTTAKQSAQGKLWKPEFYFLHARFLVYARKKI